MLDRKRMLVVQERVTSQDAKILAGRVIVIVGPAQHPLLAVAQPMIELQSKQVAIDLLVRFIRELNGAVVQIPHHRVAVAGHGIQVQIRDHDRIDRHVAGWQDPLTRRHGGNVDRGRLPLILPQPFVGGEEERPVAGDRSADRPAKLVAIELGFFHAEFLVEEVRGVEGVVAVELEHRPTEPVRA